MLTLTGRLQHLADQVAGLGLGVVLHIETTDREINWRLAGADPMASSPVNASGTQKSEALAVRDILRAAHEQLWEGIEIDAGAPGDFVAAALPPSPPPGPPAVEAPPPDTIARLVPQTVEQAQQREWLRARLQELTARLVDTTQSFEPLSPAEIVEQQELERYRGWFA